VPLNEKDYAANAFNSHGIDRPSSLFSGGVGSCSSTRSQHFHVSEFGTWGICPVCNLAFFLLDLLLLFGIRHTAFALCIDHQTHLAVTAVFESSFLTSYTAGQAGLIRGLTSWNQNLVVTLSSNPSSLPVFGTGTALPRPEPTRHFGRKLQTEGLLAVPGFTLPSRLAARRNSPRDDKHRRLSESEDSIALRCDCGI
jgi:hypothetical protein